MKRALNRAVNPFESSPVTKKSKISPSVHRPLTNIPNRAASQCHVETRPQRLSAPLKSKGIEVKSVEGVKNGPARSFPVHGSPNVNFSRRNELARRRKGRKGGKGRKRRNVGRWGRRFLRSAMHRPRMAKPTKRQSPGTARILSHARRATRRSRIGNAAHLY